MLKLKQWLLIVMATTIDKQYIIAIGASAGGLEAISAFFDYTPLDAVSYIVIQHLSSDFKSHMAQILSRHTKLQVIEVNTNIRIKSNKVYLIPSNKFMVIKNGRFVLSDKKDHPKPYMTIDYFFKSLAEERGDKAIGIILSGTGKDGSKGIQAIEASGGIIIVQDPDTAHYGEMPLAAINTGLVNIILPPESMPRLIEDYVKFGLIDEPSKPLDFEISEEGLSGILGLIAGTLPFDFTNYKRPTLLRRVKRRMGQYNFKKITEYYEYLQKKPEEVKLLANDFLISVTSFFRDPEAFEIIEKTVIPDLLNHKSLGDVLKIWVPGCASGEEAYSLAILFNEYLEKNGKDIEIKIFATDISLAALDIASKGRYPDAIEKTISQERLRKYFDKEEKVYKVKSLIRRMLIFAPHDLTKNSPYCNIDLISCRNLLIYLNSDLQKKVFSMLHFGLKKSGYLFLGPSENAAIIMDDFVEISNKWNILKNEKREGFVKFNNLPSPMMEGLKRNVAEMSSKTKIPGSNLTVSEEINTAILAGSGLNGICTDENLKVLKAFGDPSKYLKNEIFNFNLNDLLPDKIAIAFKAAAHKALLSDKRIVLKDLNFGEENNRKIHVVDIAIKPFHTNNSDEKLLLILFMENNAVVGENHTVSSHEIDQLTRQYVTHLEGELNEVKHNLNEANDKIASSNENLQSFNEELLSANEELQSANEELQSLNEELQTINKEQQEKNKELSELNDDLNNYFRSNLNGQLFVDQDLLLKKFSPAAVKHINIRESDIGRPLSNITTNIKFETLIEDVKKVLLSKETIFREAESKDGNIYQVMTMPYLRKDSNNAEGAIISFYDITDLKGLLYELDLSNDSLLLNNEKMSIINRELFTRNAQLNNSRKYIEEIFNTIHEPLLILDIDLKIIRATDGFYQMFEVKRKETEGVFLYDLSNKQWDIPTLRSQLENILPEQGFFKAFEVEHVFKKIGRKVMLLTASQFETHAQQKLILLAISDLTDKRKVEESLAEEKRLLVENKERLHFAIESAGIGVWDFNPVSGEFIMDNRCKEFFGLLPTDNVDYPVFLNRIHSDDRDIVADIIQRTLKGSNNGEFNSEYRTIGLTDQKNRWIKSNGKTYFNKKNKASRFIGTILDISMDKALEENTRELLLKKDEFISIASHELKTPITSLKAAIQLINKVKNNPASEILPKLIDQSTRNVEKIGRLIDDLLNVTRMNEGQLSINKTSFSIFDMLNRCCVDIRSTGKYELIVQGDKTLNVNADEERIEQVVANFINNAVKYASESKKIYLIAKKSGDNIKVSVKDGGPGIAPEGLSHLFDRYYRADYSGGQYSGLGLGLYISSEIIKRHQGQVGVDSVVGKGSTFWFTLPL